MKPLVKCIKIKKANVARPTVSQLYIIYENRIRQAMPKKHAYD